MWRADVVHCGAAYSEFNARVFAYLEPASLPVELRRKTDKDGHTQTFLLDEQHVEDMERVATNTSAKRKAS